MESIRELFSTRRPIDRRIEKVIDYYADSEERLASEIEEYEATQNVEACFRKFLDVYQLGVQSGQVTEVGIWVSGFYGSGKSSFTKYLGFALDPARKVYGQSFLNLLSDRLQSTAIRASLRTVAQRFPATVVLLDLGAEQLAESTAATVTNVLYWKVLQLVGYSKEKKLALLEFKLEQEGMFDDFCAAYRQAYNDEWTKIHNDPLLGVSRASRLLPSFMPQDFPERDSFSRLRFEMADDVRDLAGRMIELVRRHTGRENILFLIDEAGQYVAPRGELILNLDGLARNLKELGQGKVWIVATGQQTLAEIVEKAAHNSPELNKLRDRFPISIELDARDIREITYRRLLTKSDKGAAQLQALFESCGPALITHSNLTNTSLFKDGLTGQDFVRYYPFLPQHFEVLMLLIRALASSTGGIGLRSTIRVVQDVLVDTSRILGPDQPKLADRSIGTLACADDFYITLRADIGKLLPHVVEAVDQVEILFPDNALYLRVAQAVAALQTVATHPRYEDFPRTAENIAALLYPKLGHSSLLDQVRQALVDLANTKEIGLIEDPQSGSYLFLSASVQPYQRKRIAYEPGGGEIIRVRNKILQNLLQPQPATKLENVRDVRAAVRMEKRWLIGDREEIVFQFEMVSGEAWDNRRTALLTETTQQTEYQNTVVWLFRQNDIAEDILPQVCKSDKIVRDIGERVADKDVAQYVRSERRLAERNRGRVDERLREALLSGTFIFRGRPTPVRQLGDTLNVAAKASLSQVAVRVYHKYHLLKIRPTTNLAARFLAVDRLDRMPQEYDPLHLVVQQGGSPRIDTNNAAVAETLRAFKIKVSESGSRLMGKRIQDYFAAVPYGWTKDAVRYVFAALFVAGEIEIHTGGYVIKTTGPEAIAAFKSTLTFNKVGVSIRDSKVGLEVLDRAAKRLQSLFGDDILPLETKISQAARKHLPVLIERISALPDRLRLLHLPGEERAQELLAELTDLLKGDASNAPAYLGYVDSTIPQDINWAQETTEVLNNKGEDNVRAARRLLTELTQIESLFPAQYTALEITKEQETIREIPASERFHEQLPNLRSAMRTIQSAIRRQRDIELKQYQQGVQETLTALEAQADWILLAGVDREEIADELTSSVPTIQEKQDILTTYRTLLVRRGGLAGLQRKLETKIKHRKPAVSIPAPDHDLEIIKQASDRVAEMAVKVAQTEKLTYLGIMASAMAHGLNQPLGIIRAVAGASLSDARSGLLSLEEVQPKLEKILLQTDRLANIINNMRAFARGDWQEREEVDLSRVVEQMCDMFADQFSNHNVTLKLDKHAPSLPVLANPVQVQEVLINLLTNARDAVEKQSEARVWVTCWRMDDNHCAFSVADNGPGLAPEYQERIFTPFVTTKPSEKGTGLGLYTSWHVIEQLGGQLKYKERSGGGACFIVQLPPFTKS